MSQPTPLWRDPLFSPGDRFPLGPPRGIMDNCQEGPSGPATRPFSLRHVVAGARLDTPPTWRYTYCHERQIALIYDDDGSLVPLLKHTKPGPTPPTDTSGVVDGNPKNPPPEEMMNPDYQATWAHSAQRSRRQFATHHGRHEDLHAGETAGLADGQRGGNDHGPRVTV